MKLMDRIPKVAFLATFCDPINCVLSYAMGLHVIAVLWGVSAICRVARLFVYLEDKSSNKDDFYHCWYALLGSASALVALVLLGVSLF